MRVADDTGDVPNRPNVCVTDVPRDDSVASERRGREPRPANRHPRTVNREPRTATHEPATRDYRPATREHRPADDRPKRLNVYATDVQRDIRWRPSDRTPFQIKRTRAQLLPKIPTPA